MSVHIVVMGVAGSGKSTVGAQLAERLGLAFIDGDDLHAPANIEKMSAGVPLTDEDRAPWLRAVGSVLAAHPGGVVVACSALRRSYRDLIRSICPDAFFVHLDGASELLAERMAGRLDHFMPLALLEDQRRVLEPLEADEAGLCLPISDPVAQIVDAAARRLGAGA